MLSAPESAAFTHAVGSLDTTVAVLQRDAPLAADVVVSQRIGRQGGVIRIPEAGFALVVPPNAIRLRGPHETVTITVRALAGHGLAYEFQPHGLRFHAPVGMVQDLSHTAAYDDEGVFVDAVPAVAGWYYRGFSGTYARVTERRPTLVDRLGARVLFTTDHFSGYIISSGR